MPELGPASAPTSMAVVWLTADHVGIHYQDDEGRWRSAHFGLGGVSIGFANFHHHRWVVPAWQGVELSPLAVLIEALNEDIPYGFEAPPSAFGRLAFDGSRSLTCASFVLAMFEAIGAPLVELDSWLDAPASRKYADLQWQEAMLLSIEGWAGPVAMADARRHLGAPRVRPAEVAAASGLCPQPVAYARAAPAGEHLVGLLGAGG